MTERGFLKLIELSLLLFSLPFEGDVWAIQSTVIESIDFGERRNIELFDYGI